ncbi:MAG: hypothetical protein PHT77_01950 [Bacteroidales bacterium]|nr:hypothetical protein [Bacteroidales bacterium]MDY0286441.1 hypothetical protein [Bacteroidales bacterium]
MNIIQIIPGSGGSFYCGNCLRDSNFFEAMKAQGQMVIKIPMYLPLFDEEPNQRNVPVFYGAISMYLKQNYRLFRTMPSWMERLLNSTPLLKLAARISRIDPRYRIGRYDPVNVAGRRRKTKR